MYRRGGHCDAAGFATEGHGRDSAATRRAHRQGEESGGQGPSEGAQGCGDTAGVHERKEVKRREFIIKSAAVGAGLFLPVPAVAVSAPRAYRDANTHRDFAPCHACGVKTWGQHAPDCPKSAVPVGEEKFYESLRHRLIKIRKRGCVIKRLAVEPEHQGFRFVRVWVEGDSAPYTWNHPC